jgi:hypothetical protein
MGTVRERLGRNVQVAQRGENKLRHEGAKETIAGGSWGNRDSSSTALPLKRYCINTAVERLFKIAQCRHVAGAEGLEVSAIPTPGRPWA